MGEGGVREGAGDAYLALDDGDRVDEVSRRAAHSCTTDAGEAEKNGDCAEASRRDRVEREKRPSKKYSALTFSNRMSFRRLIAPNRRLPDSQSIYSSRVMLIKPAI